jgi:carbamate kinase
VSADQLHASARSSCQPLALLARDHQLVVTHGNGPQVGLLALQDAEYRKSPSFPLDVLGAETQGMIGYILQQELSNALSGHRSVINVLTTTVIDECDSAFARPTKPIGPQFSAEDARAMATAHGWKVARDGKGFRRVVCSPRPVSVVQAPAIRTLLEHDYVVVCAGGGGVPVRIDEVRQSHYGIQAVVDKDAASAALAIELDAEVLIILTDGDYVSENWGTARQRNIALASADAISRITFDEGSMQPKVDAAVRMARAGGRALIGPLDRLDDVVNRVVGTEIRADAEEGIVYA